MWQEYSIKTWLMWSRTPAGAEREKPAYTGEKITSIHDGGKFKPRQMNESPCSYGWLESYPLDYDHFFFFFYDPMSRLHIVWLKYCSIKSTVWKHVGARLLAKHPIIFAVKNHRAMFAFWNIQASHLTQIPTYVEITDSILPHRTTIFASLVICRLEANVSANCIYIIDLIIRITTF